MNIKYSKKYRSLKVVEEKNLVNIVMYQHFENYNWKTIQIYALYRVKFQ